MRYYLVLLYFSLNYLQVSDGYAQKDDALKSSIEHFSSPDLLSEKPECKDKEYEKKALSPCDNFWEYACKHHPNKKHLNSNGDYTKQMMETYNSLMEQEIKKRGYYEEFNKKQKGIGDDLHTADLDTAIANYKAFYKKNGKQGLHDRVIQYLIKNYSDDFYRGGVLFEFSDTLRNKIFSKKMEQEAKEWEKKEKEWEEKFEVLKDKNGYDHSYDVSFFYDKVKPDEVMVNTQKSIWDNAFKYLTEEEFTEMVYLYLAAIHKSHFSQFEDKIEKSYDFRKAAENIIYPKEVKNRIKNIFQAIKRRIFSLLKGALKEEGRSLLNMIGIVYPSEFGFRVRDHFVTGGAKYIPSKQAIMIHGGFGKIDDLALFTLIAHEWGHAIDFNTEDAKEGEVFNKVKDCLKSKESIKAEDHHVHEAFADWFAAEMLVKAIEERKTPFTLEQKRDAALAGIITCRDLSEYIETKLFSMMGEDKRNPHPRWDKRANRILMAHPYIRTLFNCPKTQSLKYCDITMVGK